jgi:hypothetical protein
MSSCKEVNINGELYIKKSELEPARSPGGGMPYCIIRCRDAGVHAGFVESRNGREVELVLTRRLWRWYGKTLSGLATEGSHKPEGCKYSDEIPRITLLDACEVIPCSERGMKSIREDVGPWKNK